ncbi:MAG: MMPL family transporter [Candidatus Binatia bacterium]
MYTPPAMNGFARRLVRHPATVLVAAGLVTALLGVAASRIRVESSLESVLAAGDPEADYYARVRSLFGGDDVAVVGVLADDVLAPATLEKMARVTDALAKIPGVERVMSLTNAVDPAADVVAPPRLLPRIPPTPDDTAAVRQKLAATPLYRKNLVADDLRGAAINVVFRPLTDAEYHDRGIDAAIMRVLAAEPGPERFLYTGAAHVKQAAVTLMQEDLLRFTPWALGLVAAVLGLAFRTRRGVVLPLLTVLLAVLWTLGLMEATGHAITLGTFILPPLLLVVGSSYAIHVMARYYEQVEREAPADELVIRAIERVWPPLVISAFATAVGFGSLMVSRIPAIWELGCFAVVGVACLTVSCLTFLPAALAALPAERTRARRGKVGPGLAPLLARLSRLAHDRRTAIFTVAVMLAVAALVGIRRITVDSDFVAYFTPRSEVRLANEAVNQHIVGSNPFYVVIEGTPGTLKRWEVLKLVEDLQRFLDTVPGITSSISLVDYLELLEAGLNRAGGEDLVVDEQGNIRPAEKPKTFWEDPKSLDPVLKMVATSPATFKSVVTADFSKASVLVRTRLSASRAVEETLARVREYVAAHFPADVGVRLTGNLVLLTGTTSDIVRDQVESLGLALGVIFVVLSTMFLSGKIGLLAILPNVLPVVLFYGVMGWLGIQLNFGTSLIAAISLGIAVDATIHYMARLNRELAGEIDQRAAIGRALETVGVPIIFTTVALFLGFLTFACSSFVPIQSFGILSGVTMAASLGTNLVLLPALLATTKIITLWDLVAVKLGRDPTRTIPLFAGLRPTQARVVVLMGEIKRFRPGETIVRQGDPGDEMYVILDGRTEVWVSQADHRQRIFELRRGDVFGEMSLVRRAERSADVVAADAVEVLAVSERFLERLRRRYPRIASRLFLNLTSVLSDRLQSMNARFVGRTGTAS